MAKALTPRTRLVVLTNFHNPSGVRIDDSSLREVGELARNAGARVLVDEVYLEMLFDPSVRSAFHLGEHFRGDQQPDQGLRTFRVALRVDSGGAGNGGADVAAE